MLIATGGLSAPDFAWNTAEAIEAHEDVHVERYKVLLNKHFPDYVKEIEAIQTPILPGDTLDAAGITQIKARIVTQRSDAQIHLIDAVKDELDATGGSHSNPDEFYREAIRVLAPIYSAIDQRRNNECQQH